MRRFLLVLSLVFLVPLGVRVRGGLLPDDTPSPGD